MSYLTAGDSFKLSDRSITTTKTYLIGSSTGAYQYSSAAFKRDSLAQGYKNANGNFSGPSTIVKARVDVN